MRPLWLAVSPFRSVQCGYPHRIQFRHDARWFYMGIILGADPSPGFFRFLEYNREIMGIFYAAFEKFF
jgi:hypothetical protein